MKKFLKTLLIILIILIVAAAVAAGLFYKSASPSVLADLGKSGGSTSTQVTRMFKPKFKTAQELQAGSGEMTSSFWTSKWCLDMDKKAVKSVHYDMSGYSFGEYLKALKGFNFKGFRGVVSMNGQKNKINVLVTGGKDKAKVTLYSFGKTKLSGKTLEIKIEEAVYKGESGEPVLPVTLRDYTANAGDKLEIDLTDLDEDNVYKITVSEADPNAAPAYENKNIPKSYVFSKDLQSDVSVAKDGDYAVDCIFKNSDVSSFFEIYVDGKSLGSASTFESKTSACASATLKLTRGKHKIRLVSEEKLPEFKELVISPIEDSTAVYLIQNSDAGGTYIAAAPAAGTYNVTSIELKSSEISVNSQPVGIDEIGSAQIQLNKGFNEIKFSSSVPSDLKITKTAE